MNFSSKRFTLACPELIRLQNGPVMAEISENFLLNSAIHSLALDQVVELHAADYFLSHV